MPDERVAVGRVVKPHGIRGEVAVDLLADLDERFAAGALLHGRGRSWTIETARLHQGRVLVKFAEVAGRNEAELLRGLVLEAAPVDTSGTEFYYAHELAGMLVVTEDGDVVGEVTDIIELPAAAGYDLLEVTRADGSVLLLPASDDLVEVAETEDGADVLLVVEPPLGLLDPDAGVEATPQGPDAGGPAGDAATPDGDSTDGDSTDGDTP